jgi:RecB family exonuclease
VPPAVSHSALALYGVCPLRYFAEKVVRIGTVDDGSDGALRFGEAVHAALRLSGPAGQCPAPERLAAIARYWGLDAAAGARLRAAVDGFARSDACRDAHALGESAREVPFAVPLDGATLVGKLDLLARDGTRALVVDYKTGEDAVGEDAFEKHRAQADRYALAVLSSGSRRVDVVFVGVETDDGGRPRQVSFGYGSEDADRLRQETSDAARTLAAGPYEPLTAYSPGACDTCPAAGAVCPVPVPVERRG